jgi:DNA-directed RNA polymerase specialized sigma24 family protein
MLNALNRPKSATPAVPAIAAAAGENSSDVILVNRIAAGDRLAMQALFARHRTSIYRWLLRFVSSETLAEDLLSEVFLDVWRQADRFEGRSSVSTWLMSIARYKAHLTRVETRLGVDTVETAGRVTEIIR